MGRDQVIQQILDTFLSPTYLEIGVQNGYTFHSLKASRKVAVDPKFEFDLTSAQADVANKHCVYYETTSDEYFTVARAKSDRFDVIFIDGLHTFEQSLKDLLNSMMVSRERSVFVIDDVMPVTYASSISDIIHFSNFRAAEKIAEGSWMGDVYKLVFFIKSFLPLFDFATIEENHGQTVMWRKPRSHISSLRSVEQIARLDYSDFILNKQEFNILPFGKIQDLLSNRD